VDPGWIAAYVTLLGVGILLVPATIAVQERLSSAVRTILFGVAFLLIVLGIVGCGVAVLGRGRATRNDVGATTGTETEGLSMWWSFLTVPRDAFVRLRKVRMVRSTFEVRNGESKPPQPPGPRSGE
jgi:hypothetical protein